MFPAFKRASDWLFGCVWLGKCLLLAQKKRCEIGENISIVFPDSSVLNQGAFMTDETTASLVATTYKANLGLWQCCAVKKKSRCGGDLKAAR
jgi:hypothetical protein